ncbi:hypothetical protein [Streptomyces milbemycinicus]|uniref:hypothetical protein n=1 Tax=Streptomyces milbemycinicus TaxID=476552 RepID=UPI003406CE92
MTDPQVLERVAARRAELDGLEEQLVKQLPEVRSERDELAVAERVLLRMAEQIAAERDTASSPVVHVAGARCGWSRTVRRGWPSPRCRRSTGASWPRCARLGPVATRAVGEMLGLDTSVRGRLEPLRREADKAR